MNDDEKLAAAIAKLSAMLIESVEKKLSTNEQGLLIGGYENGLVSAIDVLNELLEKP